MSPRKAAANASPSKAEVQAVLAALKRLGTKRIRDEMEPRYGIVSDKAFGVPMAKIQAVAKGLGKNHLLAAALWDTGWYEARMVAAFVDEPALVTPAQMDRWCRDFDNWAICDTVCFALFDRTPHALAKVAKWSNRRDEFEKRAGFALLACVALHDRHANDVEFAKCLPLVERGAADERNFVKKGVSWALRAVGRRSLALNMAAVAVARRLAASPEPGSRWVGRNVFKELTSPAMTRRFESERRV